MERAFKVSATVEYFNGYLLMTEFNIHLEGDLNDAKKVAMEAVMDGLVERYDNCGHWSEDISAIQISVE